MGRDLGRRASIANGNASEVARQAAHSILPRPLVQLLTNLMKSEIAPFGVGCFIMLPYESASLRTP